MSRLVRLLAGILLVLSALVGGTALTAGTADATALPIAQCSTTSGVVVAVDFGHWGGPVLRSCGTTPTTGFALLNQGGWTTAGTVHDGPGFVCRIGYAGFHGGASYPSADEQKCVVTPPASAYWAFWHADPGQASWSYSQVGATAYRPAPGSVELWTFGATDVAGSAGTPTVSPAAVRANNSAPPVPSRPVPSRPAPVSSSAAGRSAPAASGSAARASIARAASSAAGPASSTRPAAGTTRAGSASAVPTATAPTTATRPSSSASVSSTISRGDDTPSSAPTVVDAQAVAAVRRGSGSATPAILAGVAVLLLAGAAVVTAGRRRREHR